MWKGCRCPQVSQRGGGGIFITSPPPLGQMRPPGKRSLRGNQKGWTWSHRYGLVSFCCLSSCHPNSLADKPNVKGRFLPSCWWCFRVETILSTSESRLRKFLREDTLGHFHHRASNRQFAWDGTLTQIAFLWVVIFSERPKGTRHCRKVYFYFTSLTEGCPVFALLLSWKGKLMRPSVLWVLPSTSQGAYQFPGTSACWTSITTLLLQLPTVKKYCKTCQRFLGGGGWGWDRVGE